MALNNLEDWLETSGVYKTLVNSSPDAIHIHIDGKIIFANPAALQLWGANSAEQVLGQPISDHIPAEYRDEINQSIVKLMEFGHSVERIETKYQRLDGTLVDVEVQGTLIEFDEKKAVLFVARDIANRKQAENILQTAIESIPEGLALYDADDRLALFNENFVKGRGELKNILKLGMTFEEQARLREASGIRDKYHQNKTKIPIEERIRRHQNPSGEAKEEHRPDGTVVQTLEVKMPNGCIALVRTDITRLKNVERALRASYDVLELRVQERTAHLEQEIDEREKSQALLQNLINTIPDGFAYYDAADRLTLVNENYFNRRIEIKNSIKLGDTFEEQMAVFEKTGHHNYFVDDKELSVEERLAHHKNPHGIIEARRPDGSIVQIIEIKTAEGGTAVHFSDVTAFKALDKLKSEFISTVSHELRTPLTSIKGSLGMIGSGALNDPIQITDMVELASNNTERLINLVNDLLDMEKLQSGRMKFNLEILDVQGLVENSLAMNKPYADEHGIEFKLVKSPKMATVYGDPDRLAQVISNLLSNAAKFSPSGETVEISIERSKKSFRVNVVDRGPGIPKNFHDRIFGRFSQADSADNREKGGTGLGLNISKSIIEQHGGTISFESEVGKGSKFYFELPEHKRETIESVKRSSAGVAEINRRDLKGRRILVMEDDPDVAKLLSMMLKERGYSVDIAHSAHEAKAMISTTDYVAVTVDILLPDQDGISLVRELRAQERTRNLATIVVSAKASDVKNEVVSASMGIIDWLDKPIDQDRLIKAVNQAAGIGRSSGIPRVLHVEDDVDLGKVMTAMIGESMDYVCARTFGEARRLLLEEKFNLAILDVGLPDGNGLDLLDTLIGSDNDGIPIIIFSSDGVSRETAAKVEAALVKSNHSNQDLIELMNRLIKKVA